MITYWKGDKAEYTGKTDVVYGAKWYEIILLEGHNKGQYKLVSSAKHERDTVGQAKQ